MRKFIKMILSLSFLLGSFVLLNGCSEDATDETNVPFTLNGSDS